MAETGARARSRKGGGGKRLSRRSLLTGAAAGGGLALAWTLWPRRYDGKAQTAQGEAAFGAFVKVDGGGQVIVLVPQAELGQGVFTLFAQIVADELGADWRTVAVQPVPPSPVYTNKMLVRDWFDSPVKRALGSWADGPLDVWAERSMMMLTGGSTSVPAFAEDLRKAGAAARVLLCMAAAARWGVTWESCDISAGFVSDGTNKARIGELAQEAAAFTLPTVLPMRPEGRDDALVGTAAPRLDMPAKIDGSANYAADIRLPDMIYAAIRQGPVNALRLETINEEAARKIPGMIGIVREQNWVAVTARNWWAANQALNRLDPVFLLNGPEVDDRAIEQALEATFSSDQGARYVSRGDLTDALDGARVVRAGYSVAPALHLPLEPMAATARVREGDVEVWMPTQAPVFARRAIAAALDVDEAVVTVYPLFAGGSFGIKMEVDAGVQAALIARAAKAPVQLMWSRSEDIIRDCPRAPAKARFAAKLGPNGTIEAWSAKVATPPALAQLWRRINDGDDRQGAIAATTGQASLLAVSGMDLPYDIAHVAVDHFPADIALPTGRWRSNADSYGAFFTESFVNELATYVRADPLSFRLQMLGKDPVLAQCLTMAATLGGWRGGVRGSGQGIACHRMKGGSIAVMVEAALEQGRVAVKRMIAVADCGKLINPGIARQQIEGGLIFGLAAAMGAAPQYEGSLPMGLRLRDYGLPTMADVGEVLVEFREGASGTIGFSEIGVPAVAPALASALSTLTGKRYRQLPLMEQKA